MQLNKKSRLYYIVGASGVGKDALMQYARGQINGSRPLLFAHRYITRLPREDDENHIYLSTEEFHLRRDMGLFSLHWESHGLCYGIGTEIDEWMGKGLDVVVNGSRAYLLQATEKYPSLVTIQIEANPEIIRERLHRRGRETAPDLEKRILHTPAVTVNNLISIPNNGLLEEGGKALIDAITASVD